MLIVSYNPLLVLAAVVTALMAAFTGLCLTNGLSRLSAAERKPRIVSAAIVLGGGVWSTHFVAMLALDLPVEIFYDPIFTLASALIAILLAGGGLLLLHIGARSDARILIAGVVMGMGVVLMHYIGMWGMRGCLPVFDARGYLISTTLAVGMSFGALRTAYAERTARGLIVGAVLYAAAILVMHFTAMYWTGFMQLDQLVASPRLVPNDLLGLIVLFAAFLICGAFMLTTATARQIWQPAPDGLALAGAGQGGAAPMAEALAPGGAVRRADPGQATPPPADMPGEALPKETLPKETLPGDTTTPIDRLPYQRDGRTFFARIDEVAAIRAEGHYTRLHLDGAELFCPLPITRLADELKDRAFLRTHRSYLVNLDHVAGFERRKDQGVCLFEPAHKIPPVPVSRANLGPTMKALGI